MKTDKLTNIRNKRTNHTAYNWENTNKRYSRKWSFAPHIKRTSEYMFSYFKNRQTLINKQTFWF